MLRRNLIANYIAQGWISVMMFVFVPYYIKYLGVEAYGLVGLFNVLWAGLQVISAGLAPTINREMVAFSEGRYDESAVRDFLVSVEAVVFPLAGLVGLLVLSASGWLSTGWLRPQHLTTNEVRVAIAIMGFVIGSKLVEATYQGAVLGLQKQVWLSVTQSIFATLRYGGVVLVLALYSATVSTFFYWQILISVLTVVTYALAIRSWLPKSSRAPKIDLFLLRSIVGFSGGIMSTALLAFLLHNADKLILSKLLLLTDFGYYMLCWAVVSGAMLLVSPVTQAFYPLFTRYHLNDDRENLTAQYHLASQLISALPGAAALTIAVYSNSLLFMWTGNPTIASKAGVVLALLAFGAFLNFQMQIPYMLQLAHGWSSLSAKVNSVAVLVLIPALVVFVPRYGTVGAAIIWIVLNIGYVFFEIRAMHKRLLPDQKWKWYRDDFLLPGISVLGWLLLTRCLMPSGMNRFGVLAWLAVVSIGALIAGCSAAQLVRRRLFGLASRMIAQPG